MRRISTVARSRKAQIGGSALPKRRLRGKGLVTSVRTLAVVGLLVAATQANAAAADGSINKQLGPTVLRNSGFEKLAPASASSPEYVMQWWGSSTNNTATAWILCQTGSCRLDD